MRRYTVLLTPDQDEGGYSVRVPSLPGLHTQGEPIPEESAAPQLVPVDI